MPPADTGLRESLVAVAAELDALGMNRGSTGNLSVRSSDRQGFWITPTGMGAGELSPEALVWMGDVGEVQGAWKPSSEWPFHRAIYRCRPDLGAVLHTHSINATAVACLRRELPAFHYMVAVAGGNHVPCTGYHLFGTEALSSAVAEAFAHRHACLLANHGLVAGGHTLEHASRVLVEVEALCEIYLKALAVGEPVVLGASEMAAVIDRFATYGKAQTSGDTSLSGA